MANLTNNGITGLWIDGKPVRRASLGGKVFFEKHNYNLSVVSDKDILSYADGDNATLTATLTDYDDPVTGETVVFSCEVKSTMVDASGTHDFGGCFIVDSTNLPRGKILYIGDRSDYSLSLMNSTYYYNNVSVNIGGVISKQWYTSKIMIKDGRLFIESSNRWVEAIDISEIDVTLWEIPTETNVTVEEYFYETGVTDVNGECSVVYDSKGVGDLNIKCEAPDCSLVTEIYVETVDTSNPKSVVSDLYTAPVRFVGEIKLNGYWGGVRIYGTDAAHHYIFLSQNSYNSHESEKIWYVIGSSWVSFEAIIKDGTVQLYINDNLIQSVNTDTTGTVNLWGGSNANPVSLRNLKVTNLIIS